MAAEPEKFALPIPSELRYQWIEVALTAIDPAEMAELVTDAWRMCVPKRVAAEHLGPLADQNSTTGRSRTACPADARRPRSRRPAVRIPPADPDLSPDPPGRGTAADSMIAGSLVTSGGE